MGSMMDRPTPGSEARTAESHDGNPMVPPNITKLLDNSHLEAQFKNIISKKLYNNTNLETLKPFEKKLIEEACKELLEISKNLL